MKNLKSKSARLQRMTFRLIMLIMVSALSLPAYARTWPTSVGEGSISRWSGDRVAAFTVTIDDNHAQNHDLWAGLGNDFGMKWTWCVITDNVGSDGSTWAGWQELVDLGHGIAAHGLTAYDIANPPANITNEYHDSQQALRDNLTGVDALTMAYPNGLHPEDPNDPNDKDLAAVYYIAARGVFGGVNTGDAIDYMDPKSVSMNATTIVGMTNPGVWHYYGHTINPSHGYYEGWQSVHFHSVLESMKPGLTNLLVELQSNEADIWIGRFQDVAQYGQERENATLNVTSVSGTEIRFTVSDTLDDTLFYFPLTVKFLVDSSWADVVAVQNGQAVPAEIVENGGSTYALVQAVPDGGEVTLQKADTEGLLVVVRGLSKNRVWVDADSAGPVFSGDYETPYQTVQAGLNAAAPGDIVTVREGTYREQVTLPSGTAGQPVTLAAASGERVILNGMVSLTNWLTMTAGLYSTALSWEPEALYSGFRKMTLAREPNEGWWQADSISEDVPAETFTITDTANLSGLPHDLSNASVYIWTQTDDRFYTCPIVSFDAVTGSVEFENVDPAMDPAAGDKYWLQNQVSLIDQPGEWAAEPELGDFRVYYRPEETADLAGTQAPPSSGRVITGQNVAHVRLEGLEVTGGTDRGIYLLDAQNVEIDRCIVHDNMLHGAWMGRAQDCSVENSIFMNNRFGLVCEESTNITVEANEIGANNEDGLVFASGTSNAVARRNYIHNHLLWGHPDNSQTFLNVTGLRYIDNLIMSGRQSVMLEQTTDAEFTGNMVIGSAANMLNFGHGTVTNVVVHGNTLACSGYAALGLTGETSYDVKENVFMAGHGSQLYTVTDAMDYQGDHNLFWNSSGLVDPVILVSDGAWGSEPGVEESFSVIYENNNVTASDLTTAADATHTNLTPSLLGQQIGSAASWPNCLAGLQNSASINSLSAAIAAGDYFAFTVTPDAEVVTSYSNLFLRFSVGANVRPATTVFTLMSSETGWTAADGIDTITAVLPSDVSVVGTDTFDLTGESALQNVAAGTPVEFRIYAHNTGANPMTRIGIGHLFWTGSVDDDLRLEGGVSTGGGASTNAPETIYHTDLAGFQATTGLDLNSTNSDPLFVNAPFGINVLDSALLHQATRDTFSLRDTNLFLVGDHVEINFDGVVRTVTASSGAVVTVDPPLEEKPLKDYLIANWGTNTDFALDLGLQPGSPGVGLGQGGGTVGSSISIEQFQNGDFDGDGRRNIPQIPADLRE